MRSAVGLSMRLPVLQESKSIDLSEATELCQSIELGVPGEVTHVGPTRVRRPAVRVL